MDFKRTRAWGMAIALIAMPLSVVAQDVDECGPFPDDVIASALPGSSAPASDGGGSEVLVVLPRLEDGSVGASALELGPGAELVESRWSPVLCATVARITGPPEASPDTLVAGLPPGAIAVPNDVYSSAAAPSTVAAAPEAREPSTVRPDPYRGLQYGLDRLGTEKVPRVSGAKSVRVAILDSRPDTAHPDLGNVEVIENGRIGETPGAHGTLIAGVIAATRGNGFGISGAAPNATVVAIPVCRPGPTTGSADICQLYDLVLGSDAAWAAGARIFNLSLVGPKNAVLERTVARLDSLGGVVVAAAGNEGEQTPRYPAAYPAVVSVGAVDRDDTLWPQSNRGRTVEITAPGVEVVSTAPGGGFTFADGTSLATAHVSALLAVLAEVAESPHAARQALFTAGHARPESTRHAAALPTACEALAVIGRPCDATR